MTKAFEDMTREERDLEMQHRLTEVYEQSGSRYRLSFKMGPVTCFTEPMSVEKFVEVYHGYPDTEAYRDLLEVMDGFLDPDEFPNIQYEHIEGKVWRNYGQEYND